MLEVEEKFQIVIRGWPVDVMANAFFHLNLLSNWSRDVVPPHPLVATVEPDVDVIGIEVRSGRRVYSVAVAVLETRRLVVAAKSGSLTGREFAIAARNILKMQAAPIETFDGS